MVGIWSCFSQTNPKADKSYPPFPNPYLPRQLSDKKSPGGTIYSHLFRACYQGELSNSQTLKLIDLRALSLSFPFLPCAPDTQYISSVSALFQHDKNQSLTRAIFPVFEPHLSDSISPCTSRGTVYRFSLCALISGVGFQNCSTACNITGKVACDHSPASIQNVQGIKAKCL